MIQEGNDDLAAYMPNDESQSNESASNNPAPESTQVLCHQAVKFRNRCLLLSFREIRANCFGWRKK